MSRRYFLNLAVVLLEPLEKVLLKTVGTGILPVKSGILPDFARKKSLRIVRSNGPH
jgi:hypothetical protein